jgi:hypothetical protein
LAKQTASNSPPTVGTLFKKSPGGKKWKAGKQRRKKVAVSTLLMVANKILVRLIAKPLREDVFLGRKTINGEM